MFEFEDLFFRLKGTEDQIILEVDEEIFSNRIFNQGLPVLKNYCVADFFEEVEHKIQCKSFNNEISKKNSTIIASTDPNFWFTIALKFEYNGEEYISNITFSKKQGFFNPEIVYFKPSEVSRIDNLPAYYPYHFDGWETELDIVRSRFEEKIVYLIENK